MSARPQACADVCTATAKPGSKARRLPFAKLPETGDGADFWLAAWTRETAKLEALVAFNLLQSTKKVCDRNERLYLALIGSEIHLKNSAEMSLNQLQYTGGLMYAFAESTKFARAAA
ncbi:hypothetical protein [Polaromonas hydrogenivorans]|uniref:Uncharacterized protein n=1 Tax=Polaromonas hydrogenivorans TaxID=335476 RepID=A0AAU7LWF2_9BURK